jgi:hypothetical protein
MTGHATLATYLASLAGSWRALAAPRPRSRVVADGDLVAFVSPDQPVFSNAAVLTPAGVGSAADLFADAPHALRSLDEPTARAIERAGYRPDDTTVPMVLELADLGAHPLAGVGALTTAADRSPAPARGHRRPRPADRWRRTGRSGHGSTGCSGRRW